MASHKEKARAALDKAINANNSNGVMYYIGEAQVEATLAVAEQLFIANSIALVSPHYAPYGDTVTIAQSHPLIRKAWEATATKEEQDAVPE